MLSVANSCHNNENFKNGKHHFIDKCPTLGTCANKSPLTRAKAWMQKPQDGGKFFVLIPGGADDYQDEIDTCITIEFAYRMLQKLIVNKLPNVRKQF